MTSLARPSHLKSYVDVEGSGNVLIRDSSLIATTTAVSVSNMGSGTVYIANSIPDRVRTKAPNLHLSPIRKSVSNDG